ncbi:MAG: branched-chain amino acid transaminase [Rhodocyclaceae bacterium]|nr:branched-chain amino acid transaminase [Rhodocyclaceae bacterium]MCP5232157.1 branched-chain amino acid transaminase [Zoogloeaceae bacterium]MCB1910542.1 branched-chain amino acid transaminase [Rhodocyclaceae bacterium]MCP5238527.1 branched-chain amino acid transaminase [Zoogloeaceae bacterium]MCP5254559.1 branched-chain amino acid transaminase [Zoogloeaceae bacterium]
MSMENRDGWIWLDGEWTPWRAARIHPMTHTLHYGLGCFEGIRAYDTLSGPAIFRLEEHIERLFESALILGLDMPFDRDTLERVCCELVHRNELRSGYIRPLVFLGAEKAGVDPLGAATHVMIAAWPWGAYLGEDGIDKGIRVKVSSFARHHVNVQMCRAKSVSTYTNSILACREARSDGYDEALLLDTDGFVAEGPGENVFLVKRGIIHEPGITSALDGITRRTIHCLAREAGYEIVSRRITRDELYIADEVFFSGTAAEITPVVELDRRRIGDGRPGPLTRELQSRFFACVKGSDPSHREWLTAVAPGKPD